MWKFAIQTLTGLALLSGAAQGKVISSSISTGEIPNPSVDAIVMHPSHPLMLEVRATPRAPVRVYRAVHCYAERGPGGNRDGWITVRAVPARVSIPLLIRKPRSCDLSAFAFYRGYDHRYGRIVLRIRY
jgi:hypothetical protein